MPAVCPVTFHNRAAIPQETGSFHRKDRTEIGVNPGLKIDVPTHRITPPAQFALPSKPAIQRVTFAESSLEAVGTELQVPPFTWRDLYMYVTAAIDDVRSATLRYRVGDGPEQRIEGREFPWEFSVRVKDMNATISWQVDIETSDGRKLTAKL